jgi:hypothetical protein
LGLAASPFLYGAYGYPWDYSYGYDDSYPYYGGTYAYPYESYGSYASGGSCWQTHRVRVHGAWQSRRQWVCG